MKDWYLPVGFSVFIVVITVYRMVKFGGWRGSMFNARITRLMGEVVSKKTSFRRVRMKVYELSDPESAEPRIGLEIHTSALGAWSMTPMSISRDEALQLSQMLADAVR